MLGFSGNPRAERQVNSMTLLLIESPFAGKPLDAELYDLVRALFASERLALGDGEGEEIDLHGAVARFTPRQLRIKVEGDNPNTRGSFLHRGSLRIECASAATFEAMHTVLAHEQSGLRRAFLAQEVSFVTLVGPERSRDWHFRARPEDRLKLRHGATPTLWELEPLIDAWEPCEEDELFVFFNDAAHRERIVQLLQQPRERLALLRHGFSEVHVDDNVLVIRRSVAVGVAAAPLAPAPSVIAAGPPPPPSATKAGDSVAAMVARCLDQQELFTDVARQRQLVTALRQAVAGERLTVDMSQFELSQLSGQDAKPHQVLRLLRELHEALGRGFEWTRDETSFHVYHFNHDKPAVTPPSLSMPLPPPPPSSVLSLPKSQWSDRIYEVVHDAIAVNQEIKNDAEQYFSRAVRAGFQQLVEQPSRLHRLDLGGFNVGRWGARPAVDDLLGLLNDIAQRLSANDFCVTARSKAAPLFILHSEQHLDRSRLPKKLDEAQLGMMMTELASRLPRKGLSRFLPRFETTLRAVVSGRVERDFLTFSDYLDDDDLRQTAVNQLDALFRPYGIQLRRMGERIGIQQIDML